MTDLQTTSVIPENTIAATTVAAAAAKVQFNGDIYDDTMIVVRFKGVRLDNVLAEEQDYDVILSKRLAANLLTSVIGAAGDIAELEADYAAQVGEEAKESE